jgi:hypothetical protein
MAMFVWNDVLPRCVTSHRVPVSACWARHFRSSVKLSRQRRFGFDCREHDCLISCFHDGFHT